MSNEVATTNNINQVMTIAQLSKTPAMQKRFADVLGDKAPSFLAGVLAACNANPSLLNADPQSVLASAMVSATLNLSCVPSLGQSALVPYGGNCQFQIMTRGLVQLAQRSGQYRNINTGRVYSDEYDGEDLLTGEVKFHRVLGGFRDKGMDEEIVGYFAFIETTSGFRKTEYWSKADVENHMKKFSRSYKSGPWRDHFSKMAEKTVLKSLLNHFGPMSVDSALAEALRNDQKVFDSEGNGAYADNPLNDRPVAQQKESASARFDRAMEKMAPVEDAKTEEMPF